MEIYFKLIWAYLKIGIFGFGGGYAMLSLIQQEVVQKQGWITATHLYRHRGYFANDTRPDWNQ